MRGIGGERGMSLTKQIHTDHSSDELGISRRVLRFKALKKMESSMKCRRFAVEDEKKKRFAPYNNLR
ncbi:hypothetical protein H5410_004015 [Solanum commersonii]|uniref:Uncharacterized protein n=1 Tax=Solanum commersonii TaxID=4109 RepID=A0A9J6B6S1_SOLCO|nr:hypothetical protein H5410_004015 [Solanum commersonii]